MLNYISSLYNNPKHSDVTIQFINIGDDHEKVLFTSMYAHKLILGQSPVLIEKINNDNEIVIDGNEQNIDLFIKMISWLYEIPILPTDFSLCIDFLSLLDEFKLNVIYNCILEIICELFAKRISNLHDSFCNGFFGNQSKEKLTIDFSKEPMSLPNAIDLFNIWKKIIYEKITVDKEIKKKFEDYISVICDEILFNDFNSKQAFNFCFKEIEQNFTFQDMKYFLNTFIKKDSDIQVVIDVICSWINFKKEERKDYKEELLSIAKSLIDETDEHQSINMKTLIGNKFVNTEIFKRHNYNF